MIYELLYHKDAHFNKLKFGFAPDIGDPNRCILIYN